LRPTLSDSVIKSNGRGFQYTQGSVRLHLPAYIPNANVPVGRIGGVMVALTDGACNSRRVRFREPANCGVIGIECVICCVYHSSM
jgi:hypothetical protein